MSWIETEKELPPCDGVYEVTNLQIIDTEIACEALTIDLGIADYDGYGFKYLGVYRKPRFWREVPNREKKYGKV